MKLGDKNIYDYSYNLLACADFITARNRIEANALYNPTTNEVLSLPISINLLTKSLLKSFDEKNYKLKMLIQEFPTPLDADKLVTQQISQIFTRPYLISMVIVLFLYPAMAFFIIHRLGNPSNNKKNSMRISTLKYFIKVFGSDLIVFLGMASFIVLSFVIIDHVLILHMIQTTEIRKLNFIKHIMNNFMTFVIEPNGWKLIRPYILYYYIHSE